jgi:hypothetical protein
MHARAKIAWAGELKPEKISGFVGISQLVHAPVLESTTAATFQSSDITWPPTVSALVSIGLGI